MNVQNRTIVALVVGLHGLVLAFMMWDPPFEKKEPVAKNLLVQTIQLSSPRAMPLTSIKEPEPEYIPEPEIAPIEEEVVPEAPQEEEPEPPTPLPTPVEKKVEPKVVPKKVPEKKPVPAKKEAPAPEKKKPKKPAPSMSAKDLELLKSLEESVEKIGKKSDKLSKSIGIDLPKEITSLQVDSAGSNYGAKSFEKNYQDDLALYLKSYLLLPEFGDVKVNLTLKRSGKVSSIKIVKSKSDKNKKYLEKAIKELSFPSFGKYFKDEEEHTFTLTLTSES